jgi:hypothetical protein
MQTALHHTIHTVTLPSDYDCTLLVYIFLLLFNQIQLELCFFQEECIDIDNSSCPVLHYKNS